MSVSRIAFVNTLDTLLSKGESAAIQGSESELRELYDLLDPHARGAIAIDDIDRLLRQKIWKEEPSIPSCGPIPRIRQWMLKEHWLFVDLLKKIGEAPLSKSEFEQSLTIPASFLPTSAVDELFKFMSYGQTKRLCPKELCERLADSGSFKETLRKRAVRHVVRKVLSDPKRDLEAHFRKVDQEDTGYLSMEQQYAVLKSLDCPDLSFIDKRLVIDTESYATVAQMLINEGRAMILLQLQRGCERLQTQLDKFETRLKEVGLVVTVDQARMCLPQDLRANDFFDLLVKATVGGGSPFKITEWVDNGVAKWPTPEVMLSRIFGSRKPTPTRKNAPLDHQLTLLFYKIHQIQRKNNLTARQMFDCLASSGKSIQVEELRNAVYSLLNLSSVPTNEELGLPKTGACMSFEEFSDKISFELEPFQKSLELAYTPFPGASMPISEFTKFFVPNRVTKVQCDNLLRLVFGPNALTLKEVQRQPLELFLGTVQATEPSDDPLKNVREKLANAKEFKVQLPGPGSLSLDERKITPLADAGRKLMAMLAEAKDRDDLQLLSLRAMCHPGSQPASGCPIGIAKQILEPVLSPEFWAFIAKKPEWNVTADNGVDQLFDVQAFLSDLNLPSVEQYAARSQPAPKSSATIRVNIAQAVHLRKVNGESPNTFVVVQWNTAAVDLGRTQVIYKTTCPAWLHDCDITLPKEPEAYPDGYKHLDLVLKVMHAPGRPPIPAVELGSTMLSLAPLCYLPEIDGYYNIEGSTLEDYGQIRLTIHPSVAAAPAPVVQSTPSTAEIDELRKSVEVRQPCIPDADRDASPVQLPSETHLRFAAQLREHETSLHVTESADLKKLHLTNMRDLETCVSSMLRPRNSSPTRTCIISPPKISAYIECDDQTSPTFHNRRFSGGYDRMSPVTSPVGDYRIVPPRRSVEDSRDLLFNPRADARTLSPSRAGDLPAISTQSMFATTPLLSSLGPSIVHDAAIRGSNADSRKNAVLTSRDSLYGDPVSSVDPKVKIGAIVSSIDPQRQTGPVVSSIEPQTAAAVSPVVPQRQTATVLASIEPQTAAAVSPVIPQRQTATVPASIVPQKEASTAISSIEPQAATAVSPIVPQRQAATVLASVVPQKEVGAAVSSRDAQRQTAAVSSTDPSCQIAHVHPGFETSADVHGHAAVRPVSGDRQTHRLLTDVDECLVASPDRPSEGNSAGRRRQSDSDVPPQYCQQLWDSPVHNSQIDPISASRQNDQPAPIRQERDRDQSAPKKQEPQLPRWLETWDVETSRIYSILRG